MDRQEAIQEWTVPLSPISEHYNRAQAREGSCACFACLSLLSEYMNVTCASESLIKLEIPKGSNWRARFRGTKPLMEDRFFGKDP